MPMMTVTVRIKARGENVRLQNEGLFIPAELLSRLRPQEGETEYTLEVVYRGSGPGKDLRHRATEIRSAVPTEKSKPVPVEVKSASPEIARRPTTEAVVVLRHAGEQLDQLIGHVVENGTGEAWFSNAEAVAVLREASGAGCYRLRCMIQEQEGNRCPYIVRRIIAIEPITYQDFQELIGFEEEEPDGEMLRRARIRQVTVRVPLSANVFNSTETLRGVIVDSNEVVVFCKCCVAAKVGHGLRRGDNFVDIVLTQADPHDVNGIRTWFVGEHALVMYGEGKFVHQ